MAASAWSRRETLGAVRPRRSLLFWVALALTAAALIPLAIGLVMLRSHRHALLDQTQRLQIFAASETSVHMVISDVVMPRMSGPELARRLVRADPALKVLFISGHPGETMENQGLIANAELLTKPFTAEALLRRVRSMLDGSTPPAG